MVFYARLQFKKVKKYIKGVRSVAENLIIGGFTQIQARILKISCSY
jgi:hypothetical protein